MKCSICAFAVSFSYLLLTPRIYLEIQYVLLMGKVSMHDAFQMRCLYFRVQNKKYPMQACALLIEAPGAVASTHH